MTEYGYMLVLPAVISGLISILICHLFPRKFLWLGAITGFIFGFLIIYITDTEIKNKIIWGVIVGIASSIIMVISGLISKYYTRKGWEDFNRRKIGKR